MNITSIRFATHARTWMLIAGLTALLVVVGALIGGGFLYLFAGLAVAFNVIGYWFSDRLALRFSRARPLEPGTMPELEAMVHELAHRAQVPAPRLYAIPSEQPNAFATGRNPRHAAVAVTEGLLHGLPSVQVKGVLAHEFAHIKNRDILVSSIAATVAGAIAAIAEVFQWSLIYGGGDEEDAGPLGWIGVLATIIVAPIAAALLQLAVSRQREYLADATGAQLLGHPTPLADALETLERAAQARPVKVNPATASLYIVNPLTRRGLASLFATHPPLVDDRIDQRASRADAEARSPHEREWMEPRGALRALARAEIRCAGQLGTGRHLSAQIREKRTQFAVIGPVWRGCAKPLICRDCAPVREMRAHD